VSKEAPNKRAVGIRPHDGSKEMVLIEGVEVTNGDKILFPRDGYTKLDLVQYYSRISPFMLPYLKGRPVSLIRYPDGIDGHSFFQKDAPSFFPTWVPRLVVGKKGGRVEHVLCEKAADLVYLANLACITPHIWLSRADLLDRPDRMIIDLDPSGPDLGPVIEGAQLLREELDRTGLVPFVMTTGSRGMHVVAPLDRSASFEEARAFARHIAARVMVGREDKLTMETSRERRGGRLLLDTYRNSYGQTGVAPYAVRAKDGAPVATPLNWKEVEEGEIGPTTFNIRNIFKRVKERGDPWRDIDAQARPIPDITNGS
jgi:bifunctional non-homologous end joining protein LigD